MDFSTFDHRHRISLLTVTPGYRDQNTSDWVPEGETATDIAGNFDRGVMDADDHGQGGFTASGQVTFYSSAAMKKEDRLIVYFDSGETISKTYRVVTKVHDYDWMEQFTSTSNRHEYILALEEPDRD